MWRRNRKLKDHGRQLYRMLLHHNCHNNTRINAGYTSQYQFKSWCCFISSKILNIKIHHFAKSFDYYKTWSLTLGKHTENYIEKHYRKYKSKRQDLNKDWRMLHNKELIYTVPLILSYMNQISGRVYSLYWGSKKCMYNVRGEVYRNVATWKTEKEIQEHHKNGP